MGSSRSESGCKDKNFKLYAPNVFEVFLKLYFCEPLCHYVNAKPCVSYKAGAKVLALTIQSKYI